MLNEAQAEARLSRMIAADREPTLSADDLQDLLLRHRRATIWATGTVYGVGQRIVPSAFNGRYYVCREPGTSDAPEPTWPKTRGGCVDDGDDLVWQECGPAFTELWDLDGAACDGWMQKAGMCADKYNFKDAGQTLDLGELQAHCLAMAAGYRPVVIY